MEIFFSVGEPSGDQHAAHLIHELKRRRSDVRATGFGGPLMQQAGCDLHYPLTDLAVIGFLKVVPLLWKFILLVRRAKRYFRESRPDAVVLVDFPGFNWWIARKAKAAGIPVFYYMPPQLWAWAPWRIRRVRKYVDYVLSALPFEAQWYSDRGVDVQYVGHPFFDEVADYDLDDVFLKKWSNPDVRTVGILPGSRNNELATLWPLMVDIVERVHRQHPHVQFLVACYRQEHRDACSQLLRERELKLPLFMFVGRTPEIIESADFCLMASGSVSLEMLARRTPAVVMYRIGRFLYPILRVLVNVRSITLPNLIAGRTIFPEWLVTWHPERDVEEVAAHLNGWLDDAESLARRTAELDQLPTEVVRTGATSRAAEAILARLAPAEQRMAA